MIRKGTIEEAVAKALQPAYFFAMFEEDVQARTRLFYRNLRACAFRVHTRLIAS